MTLYTGVFCALYGAVRVSEWLLDSWCLAQFNVSQWEVLARFV